MSKKNILMFPIALPLRYCRSSVRAGNFLYKAAFLFHRNISMGRNNTSAFHDLRSPAWTALFPLYFHWENIFWFSLLLF